MGPSEAVAGAALAIKEGFIGPDDKIILVGNEDILRVLTREHRIKASPHIVYRHAASIIHSDDTPMGALKTKKDASMLVALDMLKAH